MARRVDFLGRLDAKSRTPQGGLRVGANLTRTGIFVYRDAEGRPVREYRPPEEVFKSDSLDTLKLAPVTVGHPEAVRTDNYTSLNVGVVAENVRPNGMFVSSDLLVQDQKTIARVDSRDLVEISCGYEVDLDRTPGTTPEGERYDAIQRNIRYNHVALGPANWGRAGNQVRLHLDADDALHLDSAGDVVLAPYAGGMTEEEKRRFDSLQADHDAQKKRADQAEAKRDQLQAELDKTKAKLDQAEADRPKLIDPIQIPAIVAARVALETSARSVLGADAVFTKKDSDKDVPMTDIEVMSAVLAKAAPETKLDGKSADYVRARFDAIVERAQREDSAHEQLGGSITRSIQTGGDAPKSRLDAAQEKADAEARELAKAGPPAGSLTRK